MVDWALQAHVGNIKVDDMMFVPPPPQIQKFLTGPEGLGFKITGNPEFWELSSSHLIMHLLRMGGRRLPTEPNQFVTPKQLIEDFGCFDSPVLLKNVKL